MASSLKVRVDRLQCTTYLNRKAASKGSASGGSQDRMYFLAISHDHQVSYQSSLISSSVCDMRRTSHTPDNIRDVAGGGVCSWTPSHRATDSTCKALTWWD